MYDARELLLYFLTTTLAVSAVIILLDKYHYKPLAEKQWIIDSHFKIIEHYREFKNSRTEILDYYHGFVKKKRRITRI